MHCLNLKGVSLAKLLLWVSCRDHVWCQLRAGVCQWKWAGYCANWLQLVRMTVHQLQLHVCSAD